MWEAIRANQRRATLLIGLMGVVLVGLGFLIGASVDPRSGGGIGAIGALALWLVLLVVAFAQGDQVLLLTAGARRLEKQDAPRLLNVVEEMSIAAGLGTMPRVYLVEDESPNAFAVGRKPQQAAVVVTSGLLKRLNRDELQGVAAHEIGHIRNDDARFMTLAAVMLGSIVLLADGFRRFLWYGGGRRRVSSKGGGQAQAILLIAAVLAAILAPIAAQLLYFACSRRREFLADASGARFSRYPEGLASALEKIAGAPAPGREVNRAIAPLYIVSPVRGLAAVGLFSTHPPTDLRVRILRNMAGGAGYGAYEKAFRAASGGRAHCIGGRTLAADEAVPIRPPSPPEAEDRQQAIERAQEVADLLGRLGGYIAIPCACGVSIRVPGAFGKDSVPCPRCGRVNAVPKAASAAAPGGRAAGAPSPAASTPLTYRRRGSGWESFRCACGRVNQIGPDLIAHSVTCPGCRRAIEIRAA